LSEGGFIAQERVFDEVALEGGVGEELADQGFAFAGLLEGFFLLVLALEGKAHGEQGESKQDDQGEGAVAKEFSCEGLEGVIGLGEDGIAAQVSAEVLGEVFDAGIAAFAFRGGGFVDDGLEGFVDGLMGAVDEGCFVAAHGFGDDLAASVSVDSGAEGNEFKEDQAEGVKIASSIKDGMKPCGLFGRHVGGGA
jgi:hypothetical protein